MIRFDPNNFDDFHPSSFVDHSILWKDAMSGKVGNLQAQIDIIIESNLTQIQGIELFNSNNSISHTANTGITTITPFDLYELQRQIEALDLCAPSIDISYIFFDRFGNLIFQPRQNEFVRISCKQCSYKSLLLSSAFNIFTINKMRLMFSQVDQIDNAIVHSRKTFLGLQKKSIYSPKSFLRPNQYQSLIVDMPAKLDIDGEKGLEYSINPGVQRTSFNLFISKYFKQTF